MYIYIYRERERDTYILVLIGASIFPQVAKCLEIGSTAQFEVFEDGKSLATDFGSQVPSWWQVVDPSQTNLEG